MAKLKMILLLILVVVLADFAYENTTPPLELKLFKFTLGQVPTFLLAYIGLALGLMAGWFGHVFRIRKKKRQAATAQEQQAQQSQQPPETSH